MSDCGICLETLKKPVSIPCGHVHCEECLRSHIVNGKDAFISTCPTCQQTFHTAIPDLAAMPEKYQGFIQSSIRQVFIDIPSISRLTKEINSLKFQVNTPSKENEVLIARNERSLVKFEELSSNYNKLRGEHGFLMSKLTPHMF
ncbi:hypothetical protein SCLCIDRAFT_1216589 [Scleroderma citrinum Foug A]|uniref:RING-type domain-containing protein n=1 Tax=Scleroderma citrinum Foug A TaxID=1036808 RepID=A0A0C3DJ29_9AGAM|nr:hypothetical protein SCLCIDRAFT_1216589 [Scleroderma citrinum Foug A]